jgi:hypothetical protein
MISTLLRAYPDSVKERSFERDSPLYIALNINKVETRMPRIAIARLSQWREVPLHYVLDKKNKIA